MNIEIKAGEDGKITLAGKLDIDTNTHMNNIDVTGKALVVPMVNTSRYMAGNTNGTAAGAFGQSWCLLQRLGGYGASPNCILTAQDANDAKKRP